MHPELTKLVMALHDQPRDVEHILIAIKALRAIVNEIDAEWTDVIVWWLDGACDELRGRQ